MSRLDLTKQNAADFKRLLEQPEGARFIAGLIDHCGVFADAPEEGKRKVGLMLYRWALDVPGGEAAYIKGRDECRNILLKSDIEGEL